MKNIKKRLLKNVSIALIIIFIIVIQKTIVNATTENETIRAINISDNYKEWEKLPDEEKENSMQPPIYDLSFMQAIKRSNYNAMLRDNLALPSKYSLKDYIAINVKNQQKVGACWAFSMSSVLETTMANKNKISNIIYSPMHFDYKTAGIFERNLGSGGSVLMAMSYLASGYGPVYESDLPFESVYNEEKNSYENYYLNDKSKVNVNIKPKARTENITLFASIFKSISGDKITYKDSNSFIGAKTYTENEVKAMRNLIKKHIKENGAVFASFYSDMGIVASTGEIRSSYFNNATNAYYSDAFGTANHAVTLVGWDDNYSKTNFKQDKQPLNDGAYIVLNSWGKEFGDNGYLYVSYDDLFIEQTICGTDDVKKIENQDFDNIYEYDELGMNLPINAINETRTAYLESAYLANVFERNNSNKREYLTEVGLFIPSTEGVEIYVNATSGDLKGGQLVASCTGTKALEPGYRTVKLATPIELTSSKFAVKVKYINNEITQLPLECDFIASGISSDSALKAYNPASSKPGESYISLDGTNWSDIYGYNIDQYTLKDTSACIKAFSSYTAEVPEQDETVKVTGVTLNKTSEEIEIGKTVTLTANVLPSNATNKNITWKSSDEAIAKVQNGTVTGVKEGKATITVTTEDGNYKATCEITVKKTTQTENETVKVTGITLNKTSEKIQVGETFNLIATIYPANATNKSVKWKSSNDKIATISETGIIKTLKEGTCTITVTSVDGSFSASCALTVIAKTNDDDDIYKEKDEDNNKPTNDDDTTANDQLPYTGIKTIIIVTVLVGAIIAINYIKYRRLKDVI